MRGWPLCGHSKPIQRPFNPIPHHPPHPPGPYLTPMAPAPNPRTNSMLNRRAALRGLFLAPALVRAASIMPVSGKELAYHQANSLITPSMISEEFSRIMRWRSGNPINKASSAQHYVQAEFTNDMLTLSLAEFSKRIIRPVVENLIAQQPNIRLAQGSLVVPPGVDAAVTSFKGSSVRYISHYNIAEDKVINRFDCLVIKG